MKIKVGARSSHLSLIQVEEVHAEILKFYPDIEFDTLSVLTHGDLDLKTSLRSLGKTDFFTRDLDEMVLQGRIDVAIHSAKDLPENYELDILAITKGVDRSDSLVMAPGETIDSLPKGARVATSSVLREENVKRLRDDFTFVDVRGTVLSRLEQLKQKKFDALVMAEAAIVRLGLVQLNRITLPGEVTPLQGQLAVVGNKKMAEIFAKIDTRGEHERGSLSGTRSHELSNR
ncbi:MAG: hydroxymethylbilane synthase [Simkaniaceae bacterium]|nr:hydroxymethylbilane synthase [Simkaniaceae bacterium]